MNLDASFPDFACEPRNVRLGLCTDGFSPFGHYGKTYSCWQIIVTPYNLPLWMCKKRQFKFIALLIPNLKIPKGNLDIYMQPLIKEIIQLWNEGIMTYDISLRQNFSMKVVLLWSVSDFRILYALQLDDCWKISLSTLYGTYKIVPVDSR